MYQKQLGSESFWAPYIDLMPDVTFFCEWDKKDIMATMDPYLVSETIENREELRSEWIELLEALSKFPDVFKPESLQKSVFLKFYSQVCTRCFGWGIPFTSMVPMADNLNHSDVNVICETINKRLHLEPDQESSYFTLAKFMSDYSTIFSEEELQAKPHLRGLFSRENFENNQKFSNVAYFQEQAKTQHLWQIAFNRDTFDEDNDTEEDTDSDNNEDYYTETQRQEMAVFADSLKGVFSDEQIRQYFVTLKRRGPVSFFMRQEAKIIEKEKRKHSKIYEIA